MLRKCIHKTELHPENRTPSLVKWVFTLVRFVWLHETSIFDHRQANVKFIIDSFRIWLHYLSAKHDAFSNSYWMIEAIMSSFNIPLACTVILIKLIYKCTRYIVFLMIFLMSSELIYEMKWRSIRGITLIWLGSTLHRSTLGALQWAYLKYKL